MCDCDQSKDYWVKITPDMLAKLKHIQETLCVINDLDGVAVIEEMLPENIGIECQECGACGISECCPPNLCKHAEVYKEDWNDTQEDLNRYFGLFGPLPDK